MVIKFIQIGWFLVLVSGCIQGPGLFQQNGAGASSAIESTENDGIVSGAFKAGSTATQTMLASGNISGSSVKFPPGSLAIDTEITLEEGASIAGGGAAAQLGLNGGMSAAGPSVVISSSVKTNANSAFTLQIPLSGGRLAINNDPSLLIVIYKIEDAKTGNFFIGIIPNSDIRIVNGQLEFDTKYFGSFQAAYVEQKITKAIEVKTETPILTAAAQKKLDDIVWSISTPTIDTSARRATFSAKAKGFSKINYCVTLVYETSGAFVDSKKVSTADPIEYNYKADDNAHKLEAKFACEDNKGRYEESKFSSSVELDAANGAPVSIMVTPATTTTAVGSSVTFVANGIFPNGSTKDISSQVTWTSSDYTVSGAPVSGIVTAVGVGSAEISATLGGLIGMAQLSVSAGSLSIFSGTVDFKVSSGATIMANTTHEGLAYFIRMMGSEIQLWRTDGTSAGTKLLRIFPYGNTTLVGVGDYVYFSAKDGTGDTELWRTNGTAQGTHRVADIRSSDSSSPYNLTALDDTLYFVATDDSGDTELWKSDGTSSGTLRVKDINTTDSSNPSNLTAIDGKLYFAANDGANGTEPWISDGTSAGTTMLGDVNTNNTGADNSDPNYFVQFGSKIYFSANSGGGPALWEYDPFGPPITETCTAATARFVADITAFDGKLFFKGSNDGSDFELFYYNGSTCNEVDINGSTSSYPAMFTVSGGNLYFVAEVAISQQRLLKITAGQTTPVPASTNNNPGPIIDIGGTLYFHSDGGSNGGELWTHNGTTASEVLDINPGVAGSSPSNFMKLAGKLLFTAHTPKTGTQWWSSDGTSVGTAPIKVLDYRQEGHAIGDYVVFWGTDGSCYGILSFSTTANTKTCLKSVANFFAGGSEAQFINAAGKLYFVLDDSTHGRELFVTDGTIGGTTLLTDTANTYTGGTNPKDFNEALGRLYFTLSDGDGRELWRTDGTLASTSQVYNINTSGDGFPNVGGAVNKVFEMNGSLYFRAQDDTNGYELWTSDGISAASMVKNIETGGDSSDPENFFEISNTLYFTARDSSWVKSLWKSDGTGPGTTPLYTVGSSRQPIGFTKIGNEVYFAIKDQSNGANSGLWKTNGTTVTQVGSDFTITSMDNIYLWGVGNKIYFAKIYISSLNTTYFLQVYDGAIHDAEDASGQKCTPSKGDVPDTQVVNGKLFINCKSGIYGSELWVFDGVASTANVLDLYPGPVSSYPSPVAPYGSNKVMFVAESPTTGREIWVSGGTLATTQVLKDIAPGLADSLPEVLGITDAGKMVIYANDTDPAEFGHRLMSLNVGPQ